MSNRRTVELAFLLPWAGVFLLTPPMVIILQTWSEAAGFPLFIVYIFACWLALIAASVVVSRRLAQREDAILRDNGPVVRGAEER